MASDPRNSSSEPKAWTGIRAFLRLEFILSLDSDQRVSNAFQQLLVRLSNRSGLGSAGRIRFHLDTPRSCKKRRPVTVIFSAKTALILLDLRTA